MRPRAAPRVLRGVASSGRVFRRHSVTARLLCTVIPFHAFLTALPWFAMRTPLHRYSLYVSHDRYERYTVTPLLSLYVFQDRYERYTVTHCNILQLVTLTAPSLVRIFGVILNAKT